MTRARHIQAALPPIQKAVLAKTSRIHFACTADHCELSVQGGFRDCCNQIQKDYHKSQNIISPSYLPCENVCMGRNYNTSARSVSGYFDSVVLNEDPISNDAATIQNILKLHPNSAELEPALDQCGISVTEDLVLWVLQRHRSNLNPAFIFFNWASKQQNYSHGSKAYNEMVDILGRMKRFKLLHQLVDEISQKKDEGMPLFTERTYMILLNRYAAAHKVEDAMELFYKRLEFGLELDGIAFNTLLTALCRYRHVEAAESLFLLKKREFPPDIRTRNIILNGWCVLGRAHETRRVWNDIISSGCKPNLFTYGIFINSLTKSGKFDEAVDLFCAMWDKGCDPDVTICNCIIDALGSENKIKEALGIFGEMNEHGCFPDVVTYNSLIKHLCKNKKLEKAYELLEEMEQRGCHPNARTYNYFFKSMEKAKEVRELLKRMVRTSYKITSDTYNLILKMYIEWNDFDGVKAIWIEMEKNGMGRDQRSYTIMIHGLYRKGRIDEALNYFTEMRSKGLIPEPRTKLLVKAIKVKKAEGDCLSNPSAAGQKKRTR